MNRNSKLGESPKNRLKVEILAEAKDLYFNRFETRHGKTHMMPQGQRVLEPFAFDNAFGFEDDLATDVVMVRLHKDIY